jgi:hypothetical protein
MASMGTRREAKVGMTLFSSVNCLCTVNVGNVGSWNRVEMGKRGGNGCKLLLDTYTL